MSVSPSVLSRVLGRGGSSSRMIRRTSSPRCFCQSDACPEGRRAGQKLIEQHAEAVDIRSRIHVGQLAHLRLLGAHVQRRANELLEFGEERAIGEALLARRFCDAEVNDLGDGFVAVTERYQHVGGLEVAMDDPFLMCVLDGLADVDEYFQPLSGRELVLVAVLGDGDAANQLHHEIGPAGLGGAGVKNFGDAGMVHHRQRLALGFEAGDDLFGVQARLDDLP